MAPAEIGALQLGIAPQALLHRQVALARLLERRKHHRHGALGDAAPVRFGRRVRDQHAVLGRGRDVDVVDSDRILGDDAEIGRGLDDFARDGAGADRGTLERDRSLGHPAHPVFVVTLGIVPRRLAEDELAAGVFQLPVRLTRRIGRRENQNLQTRHSGRLPY